MRKITVFLMLICLVFVFSCSDNPTKNDTDIQVFTGTLGESLWDDDLECWGLAFGTNGDNEFILKVEVGVTKEGVEIWYEPKLWGYAIDKEENLLGIMIYPSEEAPVVRMGYDYKITVTF